MNKLTSKVEEEQLEQIFSRLNKKQK